MRNLTSRELNQIPRVDKGDNPDEVQSIKRGWLLYAAAGSTVTLVIHFAGGVGWGWSAFVSFVGWPLVGTLVTADDDLPGGWSNPDGTIPPPWRTAPFWGQALAGLAISSSVAALEQGLTTSAGEAFAFAGLAAGAFAYWLLRHSRHDAT